MKVIGGETGSAGWWGAVGVLGVVSTKLAKLGPADRVNDTAVGVEGVDVAEVVVRLVGGGGWNYMTNYIDHDRMMRVVELFLGFAFAIVSWHWYPLWER